MRNPEPSKFFKVAGSPAFGLKGRATVQVINNGEAVSEPVTSRNLWLDQGLNKIASTAICDCFSVAVKGTGDLATTEDLTGTANTYSIANNSTVMTRAAGTRDFTVDDVGKLARFVGGREFYITGYTNATTVAVTPPASPALTGVKITLYGVNQTGLESESDRTRTYSQAAGENSTSTVSATRTFKRTFIFDTEDTIREVVPSSNTYSQTGTTVTRTNGTRDFTSGDIGKTIYFPAQNNRSVILSVGSATTVTVDESQTNPEGAIELFADSNLKETVTGTYSRSGTTVSRVSGARNFTSADIGKVIHFVTANTEAKITSYTNATTVEVDTSGTIAAQSIVLYGFTDYQEIGFSDSEESGSNLNIRVLLSSPVRAYRSTPLRASDQLKVTYLCDLTVSPSTVTSGNLATVISDPGNSMSANKAGSYVIETFATSQVLPSGETDTGLVDLEPYYEGYASLTRDSSALVPLTSKVRSDSLVTTGMTGSIYNSGDFYRIFTGVFGLNDAINNAWRTLGLSDPDSQLAVFTFLFTTNQVKDSNHVLSVSFRKSWGRDFS